MNLQDIIITDIDSIQTISRTKGQNSHIVDRKWYGLSFCLEGQLTYCHNGHDFVSAPGYAVILPKGKTYNSCADRSGQFPLINFQCIGLSLDTITVIPLQSDDPYISNFESMKRLFPLPHSKLRVMELFYGILGQLSMDLDSNAGSISPVIQYLEEHISDPKLSNSVLAELLGFSEVHFRKQFAQLYGMPPHQYIVELRIRKAKQLLTDGILSISAIAEQCGFSSVYHFSRAFKNRVGISPSEYTRINRLHKL